MNQTDEVEAWRETYERVAALIDHLGEEQLACTVPACPDWSVTDLLSHMIGLDADTLAGDEPDDHNADWTQAQVDARHRRTPGELLAEWGELADPLLAWMSEHGTRPLNDVVIHEQDLRSAVGVPGGREAAGLAIVRQRMVERFAKSVDDLPPIALRGESWTWTSGDSDDPAVVVEASDFDLFRALTSRRTADQLRSWTTRGDVAAHLDAFAGLGPLPQEPLPE